MANARYTNVEQMDIDKKVVFYTALKETMGNASGDFIDLKSYEADMRRLIDNYIKADDSRKIGEFDDFTLHELNGFIGRRFTGNHSWLYILALIAVILQRNFCWMFTCEEL